MKIYHTPEYFDSRLAIEPTETLLKMEQAMPEIFEMFCEYQSALVQPLLKRDGVVTDDTYESLLPIAANLVVATAIAASGRDPLPQSIDEDARV